MKSIKGSPHNFNCPQVQFGCSAAFCQVQVGFPINNYASLGQFIVNDIASFDHQNGYRTEKCVEKGEVEKVGMQ